MFELAVELCADHATPAVGVDYVLAIDEYPDVIGLPFLAFEPESQDIPGLCVTDLMGV